jgi:hypothetical protein
MILIAKKLKESRKYQKKINSYSSSSIQTFGILLKMTEWTLRLNRQLMLLRNNKLKNNNNSQKESGRLKISVILKVKS